MSIDRRYYRVRQAKLNKLGSLEETVYQRGEMTFHGR